MQRLGASLTASLSLLLVAATPASAADAILRMTQGDCKRLVAHRPAPGVAYQPGIDVRGHAVAPAEPEGDTPLQPYEILLIPIELDLFERLGSDPGRPAVEARVLIGTIELRDGRAYFNGRPLEDAGEAKLAAKCRERLAGGG
ncbi:MAG: hypothetical protein OEU09_20180 [Rhodospirillales bacterium]|nr:hypothetical protein [Rhodospirillales bacterium]MDH3792599.1 hypothetical protein [Rhodospirillales bacterium]MDH3913602.1 hypothetical protein [Rhodospirillales bacterium]MDH3920793.1 hypothetical protein [Rhodospirillales bacterium]MDH3965988.1 hypothetical protein [Rhodospirillales bacterium]